MQNHLELVRDFHKKLLGSLPDKAQPLSEMDVVYFQALLIHAGSTTFNAFKSGDMSHILSSVTHLAYVALAAIAKQSGSLCASHAPHHRDWLVLPVMQQISAQINDCSDGKCESYSELYVLCQQFARDFINADFDKAFRSLHQHYLERLKKDRQSFYSDAQAAYTSDVHRFPDLSECLFE